LLVRRTSAGSLMATHNDADTAVEQWSVGKAR